MERTDLEEVKAEINGLKAKLAQAERDSLPIDNPGVVALNNRLTELQKNRKRRTCSWHKVCLYL
jgi:hypothetical protein